jgi:hypothetical protein
MHEIACGMAGHTIASLLIRRASKYEVQAELLGGPQAGASNKSKNKKPLNSGPQNRG